MKIVNYPALVFALSFVIMACAVWVGANVFRKLRMPKEDMRDDFGVILASTLTLLGLIIGFSFSMAVSRYDQRKNLEEEEANAIGTEYVRLDLLPTLEAEKARVLMREYFDQRILFYTTRDREKITEINKQTSDIQDKLWASVSAPAAAHPSVTVGLVVSGMNDVLNSQGYTQAAWWNRIPRAAWVFMLLIAMCCCALLGYAARNFNEERFILLVLPLVLSLSFFLIADIDSPRGGIIRVRPDNLLSITSTLRAR